MENTATANPQQEKFKPGDKFFRLRDAEFTTFSDDLKPLHAEAKANYNGVVKCMDPETGNIVICTHGFPHRMDNIQKVN